MKAGRQAGYFRNSQDNATLSSYSDQVVLVGDQIFTDVLAGKRAGVFILLVKPRFHSEIISINLKGGSALLINKRDYDFLEDILL